MLTRLRIRNFKRFAEVDIELGSVVVFIGPNDAGKTSALQALALWELGMRRWLEKRGDREEAARVAGSHAKSRTGVAINRRDLLSLPVPETVLLWRDLHVRESARENGKAKTLNVRIEVEVEGVSEGEEWSAGLEFDYANAESIYVRPLGAKDAGVEARASVPEAARNTRVAFLPPMSGLTAHEDRLEPGSIQVRLGQGRTAEVLRNLCHQLSTSAPTRWDVLAERMRALFGVKVEPPEYVVERGELTMAYEDRRGIRLDVSASGRGQQQTLLLLAYILSNPGSVLLLDEPDAHLELLRQRQIYGTITELARDYGCQIIAASHSEVILNEAADRDVLVAFVGAPHRIDDRGKQVYKALKSIGFEHYYLAETQGWVLYLEGSTDLAILQAFARTLAHPAQEYLARPFVHYVENQPPKARDHFHGLREAKPDLVGILLTDRLDRESPEGDRLRELQWERREIENYLCFPDVLIAYAQRLATRTPEVAVAPLFENAQSKRFAKTMEECIRDRIPPAAFRDSDDTWWARTKATDEFLDPLFSAFFKQVGLPNLMRKTDYHELASLLSAERIAPDVVAKLNAIAEVARRATPTSRSG
jgi:ABC-type hemin transport system ATPase subunit